MQNYVDPSDPAPLPTPGVTPLQPVTQPVTQLRYEPAAPWIPLTPPSTGRERTARSTSVSPWKISQQSQTPINGTMRTSPRKRLQLTPEKSFVSYYN